MKNIIISAMLFISISLSAQRSGVPNYLDPVDVNGADTVYVYYPDSINGFKSFYSLSLELYFEQLGGTSDGLVFWQVCNDTNWYNLNTVEGLFMFAPNDTVSITSGGNAAALIYGNAFNKIRAMLIGTVGDTTRTYPNYIRK